MSNVPTFSFAFVLISACVVVCIGIVCVTYGNTNDSMAVINDDFHLLSKWVYIVPSVSRTNDTKLGTTDSELYS